MASSILPTRAKSSPKGSPIEDDSVSGEDTSETTRLFNERLDAWKHACVYLEDYVSTTEKMQHAHHKEYEKVLKTVSKPVREGDHFDNGPGGVNEMLDSMRSNTQGLANSHLETAKTLKGSVLPIFERLHAEIKSKQKEIVKTVGKGSKGVDKARSSTQKHIELLGQHSAGSGSFGSKPDPHNDPYVLQKGIFHRLGKQIGEENATRQDMLTVQSNFSQFEANVIQSFQEGMRQFATAVGLQSDTQKTLYSTMSQNIANLNPLHEWQAFVQRKSDVLIDPNGTPRTLANSTFANQGHASTKALCQGSLERKSGVLKNWATGFYAITPAGFLHEFKTDDDLAVDPKPETSLYLPECSMGGLNGTLFNIKGKDRSTKLSTSSEYAFKAHSEADARQWYDVLESVVSRNGGSTSSSRVGSTVTTSRVDSNTGSNAGSIGSAVTSPTSPTTTNTGETPDIKETGQSATSKPVVGAVPFQEHEKGQETIITKGDGYGGVVPGQETAVVGGSKSG